MVRDYELMYIVRPELEDDAVRVAVKSVRALIESHGGEVVKTTLWGKRRLAFEVKRLREGHYVLVVFHLDGSKVAEIERALRIHDTVFRHLIVVHEGPMPEPEAEIEEVQGPVEPEAEIDDADADTVRAGSVGGDDDLESDDVPSAIDDDEGDE
jgi:small subunit ribosomal protein S6